LPPTRAMPVGSVVGHAGPPTPKMPPRRPSPKRGVRTRLPSHSQGSRGLNRIALVVSDSSFGFTQPDPHPSAMKPRPRQVHIKVERPLDERCAIILVTRHPHKHEPGGGARCGVIAAQLCSTARQAFSLLDLSLDLGSDAVDPVISQTRLDAQRRRGHGPAHSGGQAQLPCRNVARRRCQCLAITNSVGKRDSAVVISSTIPSAKYSCSGSSLMF